MILPQDYIVQKFFQYAGFPRYKKITRVYEASCPICREGKSWGKKRRCYYLTDENTVCCHNCGWYGAPINWIQQVSGLTFEEIKEETRNYDILPLDLMQEQQQKQVSVQQPSLPHDCINLFDENQVNFYKNNKVVRDAVELINSRRMNTAINRPETLWLTLSDKIHKNRIVIPFYNEENSIIFYQTRAIYEKDTRFRPKYLGKVNGERSLYNINAIDSNFDYIFIFEGPIDSFFVKNGTAVAGIQENSSNLYTHLQSIQMQQFKFHKKIWVLDSQWLDAASKTKTGKLLEAGETVFIWPEAIGKQYKDINDVCIAAQRNFIDPSFFIKNSYTDLKGKIVLSTIGR